MIKSTPNLIWEFERFLRNDIKKVYPKKFWKRLPPVSNTGENLTTYFQAWSSHQVIKVPLTKKKAYYSSKYINNPLRSKFLTDVTIIENLIINGDDKINKREEGFLSKEAHKVFNRYEQPSFIYLDQLFFTWGIRHFHINNHNQKRDLLFCLCNDNNVYFIDIGHHMDMYDKRLLEIIDHEWPEIIEPFFAEGIPPLSKEFSPLEIKQLRGNGAIAPVNVNGKVFFGSDQISNAKTSLQLTRRLNRFLDSLVYAEQQLSNIFSDTIQRLINNFPSNQKLLFPLSFKLHDHPNNFIRQELHIREKSNNQHIILKIPSI